MILIIIIQAPTVDAAPLEGDGMALEILQEASSVKQPCCEAALVHKAEADRTEFPTNWKLGEP